MNVGGHLAVAAEISDEPTFWLGSVLPDLGAIGRFRLLGTVDHSTVTAGIAFHHDTDAAFHSHPWFVDIQSRLHGSLVAAGLTRGAARAIAHVGPELLLDGSYLADRDKHDQALAAVATIGDGLASLVAIDSEGWMIHLRRVAEVGLPTDYADPAAVAARLHRILMRRPRLSFEETCVDDVAEILAERRLEIETIAGPLLAELVSQLRGD
ncbi:MAG: hypothetical protein ACI8TP_001429 [Acidimicrobiales bacterium]